MDAKEELIIRNRMKARAEANPNIDQLTEADVARIADLEERLKNPSQVQPQVQQDPNRVPGDPGPIPSEPGLEEGISNIPFETAMEFIFPSSKPPPKQVDQPIGAVGVEIGLELLGITAARGKKGIGAGAGQLAFQGLQAVAPNLLGSPPQSAAESGARIGTAGTFAKAPEIIRGIRQGGRNLIRRVTGAGSIDPKVVDLVDTLRKGGLEHINISTLLPDNKGAAVIDNMAQAAFVSTSAIRKSLEKGTEILSNGLKKKALQLTQGKSREEIAKTVKKTLSNNSELLNNQLIINAGYLETLSGVPIIIRKSSSLIRKEFHPTFGFKIPPESKLAKLFDARTVSPKDNAFLSDKSMSIAQAQAFVTDLTDDIIKFAASGKNPRFLIKLKKLRGQMIREMDSSIKKIDDPEVTKAFNILKKLQATSISSFNSKLLKSMMAVSDDAVIAMINSVKSPVVLRQLRDQLGTGEWKRVAGIKLLDIIGKGSVRKGTFKKMKGDKILDQLDELDNQGLTNIYWNPKTVGTELRPGHFREYAEKLARFQADRVTGLGTVFIELSQAGAIAALLFQGVSAAPVLILLTPLALGKIFSTRTITSFLINGIDDVPVASQEAQRLATFLGLLVKNGIEYTIDKQSFTPADPVQQRDDFIGNFFGG